MSVILIIEDEPQIRRMLRIILEDKNYKVQEAATAAEGLVSAASRQPDAILLDLGLPDLPGTEVLKRLREWTDVPVLILTARDTAEDKVFALDAGADDYVTKPFHGDELLARLRVLLRRRQNTGSPVLECGSLQMDLPARLVRVKGKEVSLTATEFALLRELMRNVGKIVTHRHLLTAVWGPNATEQSQYLRVFLSHIRRKLGACGFPPEALRTETGVGYRLVP